MRLKMTQHRVGDLMVPEDSESESIYDGPECKHCSLVLPGATKVQFFAHHDRAHPECAEFTPATVVEVSGDGYASEPRSMRELIDQVTDSPGGPMGGRGKRRPPGRVGFDGRIH